MPSLRLSHKQVEEIATLLREPWGNSVRRKELADELEGRLVRDRLVYICPVCGKSYSQAIGRPRKTCSRRCYNKQLQEKRRGAEKRPSVVLWTPLEVASLIEAVSRYQRKGQWVHGRRTQAWRDVANDVGRSVQAVQTKYSQLVRKGLLEWED